MIKIKPEMRSHWIINLSGINSEGTGGSKITDINLIKANVHIGGKQKNNARTLALKANQNC
ncbi:MAG: hypothetical protein IPI30_22070 [Saprospiraceae bacterium]|nr:hypothetical protein [Candidatus Vicinibacter affinis]